MPDNVVAGKEHGQNEVEQGQEVLETQAGTQESCQTTAGVLSSQEMNGHLWNDLKDRCCTWARKLWVSNRPV